MLPNRNLIIAIDFDSTIVEDAYPRIGKPMIFALDTIKKLQNEGNRLIFIVLQKWKKLQEALDFCKDNDIEFYDINKNYSEEELDEKISRKIHANLFIDGRNIGGFIGWTEIYKPIFNYEPVIKKKKGFFSLFR